MVFFVAFALRNFLPAGGVNSRNACVNNLRWIQDAKIEWVRHQKKPDTSVSTWDDLCPVPAALGGGQSLPSCSLAATYPIGTVGELVNCSTCGPGHTLDYANCTPIGARR